MKQGCFWMVNIYQKILCKVYKSFEGEYIMEIQGKVTTYTRITENEFVEWRAAFSDAPFLQPYEKSI